MPLLFPDPVLMLKNPDIISGNSCETGFEIKLLAKNTKISEAIIVGEMWEEEPSKILTTITFLITLIAVSIFGWYLSSWPKITIVSWLYTVLSFLVFAQFSAIFFVAYFDMGIRSKEWHATEHKSIALLYSGLPLTIENLRLMPKTVWPCGTVLVSIGFSLGTSFLLLSFASFFENSPIWWLFELLGYLLFFSAISYIGLSLSIGFSDRINFPVFLKKLSMPSITIGLLFQKTLTLKEPPEEKLLLALQKLQYYFPERTDDNRT